MLDEITDYRLKKAEEIEKHKWLESEKAGKDIGEKAIREWQHQHEVNFRKHWLKTRYTFN